MPARLEATSPATSVTGYWIWAGRSGGSEWPVSAVSGLRLPDYHYYRDFDHPTLLHAMFQELHKLCISIGICICIIYGACVCWGPRRIVTVAVRASYKWTDTQRQIRRGDKKKVSIHTASHTDTRLGLVGLGLGLGIGLASQASHVYLPRMAIHTATGEASRA